MTGLIITLPILVTFLAFALKRLMTYLQALQQDDYNNARLLGWIAAHGAFDKRLSIILIGIIALTAINPSEEIATFIGFGYFLAFIALTYIEKDPRKHAKKKLALTQRARRILIAGFIPLIILSIPALYIPYTWHWVILVQAIPFSLILGNMLLQPFENAIQKGFWNEAHEKITTLQPTVIGITGSFGKTSVKHILGHILKMNAPTLVTPGSVNTPMGITRIIREQLDETHKYFIAEMGAYGPGSIERLCRLTPPHIGLITAIGHAHYERFKTLDTVAKAKFELAQAVLDNKGKMIVHERTLRFNHALALKQNSPDRFVICGEPRHSTPQDPSLLHAHDVHIEYIKQTKNGLSVKIKWQDEEHLIKAPLYGLHHGHNLALAFVTALELGIAKEAIVTALKRVPQIEHRLEVKVMPDGSTIIDDAFNANPIGFKSALELLQTLKIENNNGGRAILITPGMVELGSAHDEAHKTIGKQAALCCDIALIVKSERIPTFIEGFKSKGTNAKLIKVESFAEASAWMDKNKRPNDIVLLENDLPDIYEHVPSL